MQKKIEKKPLNHIFNNNNNNNQQINPLAIDLLKKMLEYSPYKRISIGLAMNHQYFRKFNGKQLHKIPFVQRLNLENFEKFNIDQLNKKLYDNVNYFTKMHQSNEQKLEEKSKQMSMNVHDAPVGIVGNNCQNNNQNPYKQWLEQNKQ